MNFTHLAHPLSSANGPCGEDLIFSTEFDDIQEARRFDDPSISQGEWITNIKEADWAKVIRLSEDILANKSKDLRVASWLAEARCKQVGLGGLADGYILLGLLCEKFWNDIHPLAEDNDIEQRVGALDWLANQTPRLIRETPLTQSAKGVFSSIDLASARAAAKQTERNPDSAQGSADAVNITMEIFDTAVKDTPKQFFAEGMRNAENLNTSIKALQTLLDAKMAEFSPAFGQAFEALDDVHLFFQRHAGKAGDKQTPDPSTDTGLSAAASAINDRREPSLNGVADEVTSGPIRSREQAIHQLQEIGAFFRRTEPHSPVAYLAEKAAKWSSMPLHEWLRTVVKDDGALLRMEELLGVDTASAGESE